MVSLFDKIQESKQYIDSILDHDAKIAIVLGTGLGDFAHSLTDIVEIPYMTFHISRFYGRKSSG